MWRDFPWRPNAPGRMSGQPAAGGSIVPGQNKQAGLTNWAAGGRRSVTHITACSNLAASEAMKAGERILST